MNNTDLLITLIGLGFLLIVGIIVIITSIKKNGDKKEANEFLEGLASELRELILNIIRKFNIDDLDNLDEDSIVKIENSILKDIYNTTWEYIKNVVEKKSESEVDFFTQAVLALLENREFVEDFIKRLLDNASTKHTIYNRAKYIALSTGEKRMEELEEREEQLTEEFSDTEKYVEESKEEDLPSGDSSLLPTEEDLANLNPQKDEEEEELDIENDISVEVIEEDDDIYYDKAGRARSKKTGKWTKDPKKQQK
jgi:hypothetical protein